MTPIGSEPPRTFSVSRAGVAVGLSHEEWLRFIGISPGVSAAVDLMADDNYPPDKAVEMALAAERGGHEPESWARHFLRLRRTLREM